MKEYSFTPYGVCSRRIFIAVEGDTIEKVAFFGGCDGNLKAIGKLVAGHKIDEIADILEGNTCGPKPTSCGDQLARALRIIQEQEAEQQVTS